MNIHYVAGKAVMASEVGTMSALELVELYNQMATILGRPTVKRFSDRTTGIKRTSALLGEMPTELPQPAKPRREPGDRRPRTPVFRFMPQKPTVNKRTGDTLRARCEELLSRPEGADFEQVMALVEQFDRDRGVPIKNVRSRAYELIRIMHYQLGHGLQDTDGRIRIISPQKRLHGV